MSIVTIADVRGRCPNLTATDPAIQDLIDVVSCDLDQCLIDSYADCDAKQRLIKVSTVCHFATMQGQSGQVTDRKWANGSSESYQAYASSVGLGSTQFGQSILSLDTAGCVNKAYPASQRRFITTAGTAGSYDVGVTR